MLVIVYWVVKGIMGEKICTGAGEMSQQLRILAALAKDLGSVLSQPGLHSEALSPKGGGVGWRVAGSWRDGSTLVQLPTPS